MTDTTTETRTPAAELRDAAKTLRCKHSFPCQPPHGSLARPGDCEKCGVPYDYSEPVTDDVRGLTEKFADLFDRIAEQMEATGAIEREVRLDDGRRRKFVNRRTHSTDPEPDFAWTAALKVAREIHGKAA